MESIKWLDEIFKLPEIHERMEGEKEREGISNNTGRVSRDKLILAKNKRVNKYFLLFTMTLLGVNSFQHFPTIVNITLEDILTPKISSDPATERINCTELNFTTITICKKNAEHKFIHTSCLCWSTFKHHETYLIILKLASWFYGRKYFLDE